MKAYFVTATGTDIGKTFVGSCLIRHWRASGQPATAFKPLVSGIDPDDPAPDSDPVQLLRAQGQPVTAATLDAISPWRFHAPLAPNMAARAEGKEVDYADLLAACRSRMAQAPGPLLIEGAGGVMAPADDCHTMLDWVADLGIQALLVAGTYLGSISHSLTALAVLAQRQVPVAALILSETAGSTVDADATLAALRPFIGTVPIYILPRLPGGRFDHPVVATIADMLDATTT